MTKQSILQILHLSDIHMQTKEEFDTSVVLDPLIDRIIKDRIDNGLSPEIIVVTGDIAFKGIKEEYDLVQSFFKRLLKETGLSDDKLFIVPGNHDVNRIAYRPKDIPAYNTMKELNDELENQDYRKDLIKGMAGYFEYAKESFPHLKSVHGDLVPFVERYSTSQGKNIGLVGLNSAWMCRKSPDEKEIAIGEYQVVKALEELDRKGPVDVRIFLFHHPVNWLWPEEVKKLETRLKGSIVLTGHLHDAAGGYTNSHHAEYHLFQAGGAYLGSDSNWPARYQYVTLNFDRDEIQLDFRKYNKETGQWCLDGETGDDGRKVYSPAGLKKTYRKKSGEESIKTVANDDKVTSDDRHDFELKKRIMEKIRDILLSERMKLLLDTLLSELKSNKTITSLNEKNPAQTLVDMDILEALFMLERAVNACFKSMRSSGTSHGDILATWESSVAILGWLVLLSVDYTFNLFSNRNEDSDHKNGIHIEIPVVTDVGSEIAYSALKESMANLTADHKKIRVYGKGELRVSSIESGWEDDDVLQFIKKQIWIKIFKCSEKEAPTFIGRSETDTLNTRIEIWNRRKENFYLTVTKKDLEDIRVRNTLFTVFRSELPALHTVLITVSEADETIFIVSEPRLYAYLIEFFQNRPE